MERLVLAIVAISAVAAGSAGGGAVPAARAAAPAGSWGRAIEVPGLGALNKGEDAVVTSVSCASAGNCTAVGDYTDRSGRDRWFGQVFAVSQKNDRWGKAEQIPGTAALNVDDDANVSSVSCASPGNCSAVGDYTGRSGYSQAFVAVQKNGTWGTAERVPGLAALDQFR